MGACGGKSSQSNTTKLTKEQSALAKQQFEVGPEIFVNLKVGDIQDTYTLNKILGEGSYGQVRLVTHKQNQAQRAMKQISKRKILKEQEQEMFNEVRILQQADHPNIVKLYELYQDSQNYYLVTEYLNGGELLDKLTKLATFSERMAADYMKQILSALSYCHQQQIIHRDLKPANIMLATHDPNSPIKIIDFGTAKKQISGMKQNQLIGTPLYIAPEVIDKNYNEKCDVWSCGVILYQILTGKFPFNSRVTSLPQLFANIKSGKFYFDIPEFKNLSFEAQSLIKKMLLMDPVKRISAQDALNDPWIKEKASEVKISAQVLQNIEKFQNENQMRAAILQLIVSQMMTNQEKEELNKAFQSMDTNQDGMLSQEELYNGYFKVFNDELKAKHLVESVFKIVDSNHSGRISYTEFLVAASNEVSLLSKKRVDQCFKMFDKDGNGIITVNEIQDIMCGVDLDNDNWKQVIKDCDKNGDGQISKDEFIQLLFQKMPGSGQ